MIRIHRKGYRRRDGVRVRATDYLARDTGKPGRTRESQKLPFTLRRGKLRGWKKDSSAGERRRILDRIVRNEGYSTATRRLTALKNFSTDRETDAAVNADLDYLRREHRGG